jgi:hypothetical protein
MTPTESRQLASLIQTFTPIEKADFYYFTIVKNQDPMAYINNMEKASFGGDRSEAGRYAANIRWQGNRKGDEGGSPPEKPLKEQIEDVAAQLRGLSSFPETNVAGKSYSESYGQYFFYRKKGLIYDAIVYVAGQPVMDAEKSVNALGVRVLTDAGARTVQSGFCTQQELDDAIAYQSRPSEKDLKEGLAKSLLDRAMDKDPKVYPLVKDAVDEYERLKNEAKVAKGVLIKATKEYKRLTKEGGYSEEARQAYQVRVEMQRANVTAKYELTKAQQVLDARLSDLSFDDDTPLNSLRTEIQQAGSSSRSENHQRYLDIYREVGQEVKKTIGQYRPMAEKYPVTVDTSGAPRSAIDIIAGLQGKDSTDGKQQKIIAEVASRFPQSVLGKIPSDVKVEVRSRSGGNWSESRQRIVTDMEDADTLTHETIHALTFFSRPMRLMEQAALSRRTWGKSGDLTTPMKDKVKQGRQKVVGPTKAGLPYSRGQYIPDDFSDPYQGRIYNDRYTETLTVATENLFGGGTKLRGTGRADRDLMATALGALLTAELEND